MSLTPKSLLLACILPLAGLPSCGESPRTPGAGEGQDDRPPLVRVAAATEQAVRREIENTAHLESEHEVTVYSKLPGRITEVLVDEGARVSKGQVIAKLDDREAAAAKRQVEVQLADRKVRHELAKLEIESSARRVKQAQIDRDRAHAEWTRQSQMDPGIVIKKVLEEAKFALDSSEEALQLALFAQKKATLDSETAENAILELQARLEESDLRLVEHSIKAPIDGVIDERRVKGGETIASSTVLFVVTDLDNLISHIALPQTQLPLVGQAREALFTTDAFGTREFTADIDLIGSTIDQTTGSFRLRMRVRKQDAKLLRPGMFLRVRILTEKTRQALMVPKAALLAEGDRFIVFALRGNSVEKLYLDPGVEDGDFVESRNRGDDAVHVQDQLVVAGHEDLKDQDQVEVTKE